MKIKTVTDKTYRFSYAFDIDSGAYYRSNVIDDLGNETNHEPFQGEYPHLLDIGIMGTCLHGKSGLCKESQVGCYQNGNSIFEENMSLENYKKIVDDISGKIFQVALGGRGDPNHHDSFEEILKYSVEHDIIPNLTTSGYGMTDKQIHIMKKYCGAVAVSWYRNEQTLSSIKRLVESGVKTNIHYVLSNQTIHEALRLLKFDGFPKGINRVIFLLHKPIGLGKGSDVLRVDDQRVVEFFQYLDQEEVLNRVGFDSCTIPGLINLTHQVDMNTLDTCEAARFSAYVSSSMMMSPCSFDRIEKYAVSLIDNTVEEVWKSDVFETFRNNFRMNCKTCLKYKDCLGGCPLIPEIVLCDERRINNEV
jgi:radical SAM protein with 4Fe4S-binding SPASM domain